MEEQYKAKFDEFRMQQIATLLMSTQILKGQLLACTTTSGLLPEDLKNYLYGQFLQMAGAVEVRKLQ